MSEDRAPILHRMFPWFFREPPQTDEGEVSKPYYEIWFDGSGGDSTWKYAVYDATGKRRHSDYHFSERRAKEAAKYWLRELLEAEENKRKGKTEPQRYYA